MSPSEKQSGTTAAVVRSCTRCRQRKVKCDKDYPSCANCRQSDADCIYPAGKGRAPKRPRSALDPRLADRLSRLEDIIRQASGPKREEQPRDMSLDESVGRLMINETNSLYISNGLWSVLATEIEELREMLLDPVSDDENEQAAGALGLQIASQEGSNAAIFGYRSVAYSLQQYHPSLQQAASLFFTFTENVIPVVHIFHVPSLTRTYWEATSSLDSIDRNTEALLFAVYYAAITSMDAGGCMKLLGMTRETALQSYRFVVEQALARADLLNTQSLTVLQAAVVFLSALRNQDESRTTWSLTCLVYHIAQAMGLHRDGTVFGVKPYETELRRRLWWQIVVLDIRAFEYHGYEPIVQESTFDTKPPLHINDADLFPEMTEPPAERCNEVTDMTLAVIRSITRQIAWKLFPRSERIQHRAVRDRVAQEEVEKQLEEFEHTLQDKYIRYCDTSPSPFQRIVAASVGRLVVARFWLIMHHARASFISTQRTEGESSSSVTEASSSTFSKEVPDSPTENSTSSQLLQASIKVLEITGRILIDPEVSQWSWYSTTHIPWSAMVLVLSEICSHPSMTDCRRAWIAVDAVYTGWKKGQSNFQSAFAISIQRLMEKARRAMESSEAVSHSNLSDDVGAFQQYHPRQPASWPDPSTLTSSVVSNQTLGLSSEQQAIHPIPGGTVPGSGTPWGSYEHNTDQVLGPLGLETLMNPIYTDPYAAYPSVTDSFPKTSSLDPVFDKDFVQARNYIQSQYWSTE